VRHGKKRVDISVLEKMPPGRSVYLFDPNEGDTQPLECNVFTIIAASPQEKHYKALFKLGVSMCYFPCWSLDELQAIAPLGMDSALVEQCWLQWGGIPRYAFAPNQEILLSKLDGFLKEPALLVSIETYRGAEFMAEKSESKLTHMVIQYRVELPYTEPKLDFASDQIGQHVVAIAGQKSYEALKRHYQDVSGLQWYGAYVGHLWEHLCHVIIPRGTKEGLLLEPLSKKGKNSRIVKKPVVIEEGALLDMMAVLQKGCYFRPRAANFPVIDAAVLEKNTVFGLQMTVASSHPPKAHRAAELLKAIPPGKTLHLVGGGPNQGRLHHQGAAVCAAQEC
jgi:hypothetical protein